MHTVDGKTAKTSTCLTTLSITVTIICVVTLLDASVFLHDKELSTCSKMSLLIAMYAGQQNAPVKCHTNYLLYVIYSCLQQQQLYKHKDKLDYKRM